MAKISKVRGRGFEYRLVSILKNEDNREDYPKGWDGERNSLSREQSAFGQKIASHDVKGWKCVENDKVIFIQIEAKKTAKAILRVQKEWIDKINWMNDELLVIGFNRSDSYAVLDWPILNTLFKRETILVEMKGKANKILSYKGNSSVGVHQNDLENCSLEKPIILEWGTIDRIFLIIPFISYIALREQGLPNTTRDKIGVANSLQTKDTDIPFVYTIVTEETLIECPRTHLPIKLIPISKR